MRGILSWGGYVPHHRLNRQAIAEVAGTGGGTGTRSVAAYDEDAVTLGVAAGRLALAGAPAQPAALWFATTDPPYLDRTNATAVHAALRLDRTVAAYDAVGSVRSAAGGLRAAVQAAEPVLVVGADLRGGLPGGPDEAAGGDGAAALMVGSDSDGPVVAEVLATVSLTEEFLDRWRLPGEPASRLWEERFGETRYGALGAEALKLALDQAGADAAQVRYLAVAGLHGRAVRAVAAASGLPDARIADRMESTVGNTGAAQPGLLTAATLEDLRAEAPGQLIVLLVLADGADAFVLRTTPALAAYRPARPVAAQVSAGAPVAYGTYLAWRGLLPVEPPRRPEPARPSAPAANRNRDWKFGLVGSRGEDGVLRMPPAPLDGTAVPMSAARGRS
jgi:3-hydroxy-3-methylglutaryl CoA synthase